ncbi:MAG: hypothetical protein MHPSP_000279 [Paramarteilia canceri]
MAYVRNVSSKRARIPKAPQSSKASSNYIILGRCYSQPAVAILKCYLLHYGFAKNDNFSNFVIRNIESLFPINFTLDAKENVRSAKSTRGTIGAVKLEGFPVTTIAKYCSEHYKNWFLLTCCFRLSTEMTECKNCSEMRLDALNKSKYFKTAKHGVENLLDVLNDHSISSESRLKFYSKTREACVKLGNMKKTRAFTLKESEDLRNCRQQLNNVSSMLKDKGLKVYDSAKKSEDVYDIMNDQILLNKIADVIRSKELREKSNKLAKLACKKESEQYFKKSSEKRSRRKNVSANSEMKVFESLKRNNFNEAKNLEEYYGKSSPEKPNDLKITFGDNEGIRIEGEGLIVKSERARLMEKRKSLRNDSKATSKSRISSRRLSKHRNKN